MADWTDAFQGVRYYVRSGAEKATLAEDLREVLDRRTRNRLDTDAVRIPIATLIDIAQRIHAQSDEIARLNGVGAAISPDTLAAYEAEQEAIARAQAAHTGVYVHDGEKAALYGPDGLVEDGTVDSVYESITSGGWIVTIFDFEGIGAFLELGWPESLREVQSAWGRALRAKRAAEIEQATGRIVDGSATLTPYSPERATIA